MALSTSQTLQTAAVATGNGETINAIEYGTIRVQVTGITTATITWEGSLNGLDWVGIPAINRNSGARALTATADGIYELIGGIQLRARISSWTSGAITAYAVANGAVGTIAAW